LFPLNFFIPSLLDHPQQLPHPAADAIFRRCVSLCFQQLPHPAAHPLLGARKWLGARAISCSLSPGRVSVPRVGSRFAFGLDSCWGRSYRQGCCCWTLPSSADCYLSLLECVSSPCPAMARARARAVFSHHLSCCWLHWEIRWKAGAANRNKERPSPLLGKGGTNYGVKELALFPPMAKLHMIDVNPKQLLKH
jgi:hypothetical protein